ncbi:tRNA lysidine(34) synthetase TilS [Paenirhodobacter sp.]|uniref:tRNA lysidine(34) synthetase TilS n=1 Tax=Paenirhodobacter sp. TaxID=1965326 RepID=UPI003B3F699C
MQLDLPRLLRESLGPDAPPRVGVALSGGGDSTALLHAALLAGFAVEAATVDHGLRPGSAQEAEAVGRDCAALGVPHAVLRWDGAAAVGNVMDAGRRARLRLIGAWARGRGLDAVLLGHTADDQAETFLMRIAREAGLEGLSGMRPRFAAEGVIWHRPLLSVPRAGLRDWLRARGIGWVEDPSNDNPRFGRIRARQAMAALRPAGVTPETIGAVIGHLAAADAALNRLLSDWGAEHVTQQGGEIRIHAGAFAGLDPELRRRLLNAALVWVSGAEYPPRAAKLAALLAAPRDATLHGCRLRVTRGQIVVARELRAVAGLRVPVGQDWDGWRIEGPPGEVVALGAGIAECPAWRDTGLSRAAVLASPAVWAGNRLLAAPVAGRPEGWKTLNRRGSFAFAGLCR